jgi:hypothetical protein
VTGPQSLPFDAVFNLLSDDGAVATALHVIALRAYGPEIYEIDPLELYTRLEEDFQTRLTVDNESKLQAIMLATSTEMFFEDSEAFRGISNTLTDGDPGLNGLDDVTLAEAAWAMYEVELNHGPGEMSPKIAEQLGNIMADEADDNPDNPFAHVDQFLQERWNLLRDQLTRLEVPEADIPPIQSSSTLAPVPA